MIYFNNYIFKLYILIGLISSHLLCSSQRPNDGVIIESKYIIFQKKKTTTITTTTTSFLTFLLSLFAFLRLFIHFTFLSHIYWFSFLPPPLSHSFFPFLCFFSFTSHFVPSWGGPFSYSLFPFLYLFINPTFISHIYSSNRVVGEMTLP